MAKVKVSEPVPVSIDRAWALASDLSRLGEWLTMHEAWRGELPAELTEGAELTGIVSVKRIRNRVTWVVEHFDPPHRISLSGVGKGGTTVALDVRIKAAAKAGSVFEFEAEFNHPTLIGPLGSAAAKTVAGDIRKSAANFAALA